jgi:LysM repeat protein
MIGFVTLSVLTGDTFGFQNGTTLRYPTPQGSFSEADILVGTPDPSALITFRDTALGFSLNYPKDWRRNQKGLQVIFSPSPEGLDPANLGDAAIWFGIPPDSTVSSIDLLTRLQVSLAAESQTLALETLRFDEQPWDSVKISFHSESLGGPAVATLAATTRNEVGYFVVAVAPEAQWNSIQPAFQKMLDSFHFTTEAVLRPTDATPPPTPTPTPTPVVHIVQSGETLSHIAGRYGVTIEALSIRNDIEDPRRLRVGQKLVIPIKRK